MKEKHFQKTLNVPLSPLLLPPFHMYRKKKTLTSTPSPLKSKKKRRKKIEVCTPFPPRTTNKI
jgi:hypothetical protein